MAKTINLKPMILVPFVDVEPIQAACTHAGCDCSAAHGRGSGGGCCCGSTTGGGSGADELL